MLDAITHPCGCITANDPDWNIIRATSKCDFHKRAGGRAGMAHYLDMGVIQNGIPQHSLYEFELKDCLSELNAPLLSHWNARALEIGSGLSNYCPYLLRLGYNYSGIEPDDEAAAWARSTFGVPISGQKLEAFPDTEDYELILAAHVLEHVDAPPMVQKIHRMLKGGGRLIIVVPDDMDLVNPDHIVFFTVDSLRATLERVGFTDIRITTRRRVKHENFIYASAVKA